MNSAQTEMHTPKPLSFCFIHIDLNRYTIMVFTLQIDIVRAQSADCYKLRSAVVALHSKSNFASEIFSTMFSEAFAHGYYTFNTYVDEQCLTHIDIQQTHHTDTAPRTVKLILRIYIYIYLICNWCIVQCYMFRIKWKFTTTVEFSFIW